MFGLESLTDTADPNSLSNRLRTRRFQLFETLLEPYARPVRIIDIGGTVEFWEQRGWAGNTDYDITLLNLTAVDSGYPNLHGISGDATDLSEYPDHCFDVAFSNSVIEHLFTYENQRAMAEEVQRVAGAYFVQTPNYWFLIEPHFHFLGWQWLPEEMRVALIRRRRCGRRGPYPDRKTALDSVREVRLLTKRELKKLFPGGTLWPEKFCGLVKSWIVYGGFPKTERP